MHPLANAACLIGLFALIGLGTEWLYFNWPRIRAAIKGESR